MTTLQPKPSARAFDKVCRLARYAAKHDGWMQPVPDEHDEEDYGDFTQAHQEGWEQTNQFIMLYGDKISEVAEQQAARFGIDKTKTGQWETYWYDFYLPLKEAFWEEWEEKVGLYQAWLDSRKEKEDE